MNFFRRAADIKPAGLLVVFVCLAALTVYRHNLLASRISAPAAVPTIAASDPVVTDPNRPLTRTYDDSPGGEVSKHTPPLAQTIAAVNALNVNTAQALAAASRSNGIVICEPTADGSDSALADFGAGCGRWLHFTVGGHGELGKTPQWNLLDRIYHELARKDLRLSPEQAGGLAQMYGVTHAATGEISGSPLHCTLTYQLWEVPARKAVGEPITATGTQAEIAARLPEMARQITLRLGVTQPRIAAKTIETDADLSLFGSLPLEPGDALTDAQANALRPLAKRSPLAGMLLINSSSRADYDEAGRITKNLMTQAADNALVFAVLGWRGCLVPTCEAALIRNLKVYPDSYLFAISDVWVQRTKGDSVAEGKAAAQVVKCAPKNPDAWLTLAWTTEQQADFRKGRFIGDMTAQEREILSRIYPRYFAAAEEAAHLDPNYAKAWERTAAAATFASDPRTADEALWKALKLDKNNIEALNWGMEMYQPKWFDNPAKLAQVAEIAAANRYDSVASLIEIASSLKEIKENEKAGKLLSTAEDAYRQAVERNPGDAQAHYNLAQIYIHQEMPARAKRELREVVRLRPNDAEAHYDLGNVLSKNDEIAAAIPELRLAIQSHPFYFDALLILGYCLKNTGELDEAEKMLHRCIAIQPNNENVRQTLGDIFYKQGNKEAAQEQFLAATQIDPYAPYAYQMLCSLYIAKKQYEAAIIAGKRAAYVGKVLENQNTQTYVALSYAQAMGKHYQDAIVTCRAGLEIEPNNAYLHENLGDNLIRVGEKAAARTEWKLALQLDPDRQAGEEARKMLAKYA